MFDKFYIIFLLNWKFVINLIWFKDTKNCLFQFFYLCNEFTQNSYNNENINKILVFITHKNTTLIVNFFFGVIKLERDISYPRWLYIIAYTVRWLMTQSYVIDTQKADISGSIVWYIIHEFN